MASPHDSLFWQVFSDPRHAVGALRALLPPAVERLVAWDTLRVLPGSFKDAAFGDRHTDLLFAVDLGMRPARLYLLFEHKSSSDEWTAFQLLRYVVRILEQHRREHPADAKLPPIVAMVVHHSGTGWRHGTGLLDLFDLDDLTQPALAPLLPQLRFLLDDLSGATPASLGARPLSPVARLALSCLQHVRSTRDLQAALSELRASFLAAAAAPGTGAGLSAVLSYVAAVRDLPRDELLRVVRAALGPELEDAMTSTYDQLLNEGRLKGLQEGLERGKAEGQAGILLKQLERRFGDVPEEIVARVRGADLRQLEHWALRVLDADRLEQVFVAG